MNCVESSVWVTVKPFAVASSWIAVTPAGIESWRNAAVFVNSSASKRGSCAPAGGGGGASATAMSINPTSSEKRRARCACMTCPPRSR